MLREYNLLISCQARINMILSGGSEHNNAVAGEQSTNRPANDDVYCRKHSWPPYLMHLAQRKELRTNLLRSVDFTWLPFPDNWQPSDRCQWGPDSTELVNQVINTKKKKKETQQHTVLLRIGVSYWKAACAIKMYLDKIWWIYYFKWGSILITKQEFRLCLLTG